MRVESPGFVDLQVNGFAGIDFNEPGRSAEQIGSALEAMRRTGVTRCLPTLITSGLDDCCRCARAIAAVDDPAIAGLHLEGPYISPEDGARGAHPRAHCIPASFDDFRRRQEAAGGRVVLVTLAPEVEGALKLTERLAADGIRIAIGHSQAPPALVRDAITAGATLSTHLGNGCAAMLPRHPNLIWEQLAADELTASMIVDGHHLPPATVKSMMRVKSPQRTILVTDAVAAAGMPPGQYRLGHVDVDVGVDRRVSLRGTPYLAGSALTLPEAIGNTVRFTGLPLSTVLAMATTQPADYLGIAPAGVITAEWDDRACQLEVVTIT
jgi:N-acetylglucosamine-6-phosphate deacetylase